MSALKHGQGAAKAAPEPTRTPERQALADAIAERDRREGILKARGKIADDVRERESAANSAYYRALDEMNTQKRDLEGRQRDRTYALLRGEEPDEQTPIDVLEASVQKLDDERQKIRAELRQAEADVEALEQHIRMARHTVETCVTHVIHTDPATLAVAKAFEEARERFHRLQRALGGALNVQNPGGGPPEYTRILHFPTNGRSVPPCLWADAIARLPHDPDAVIPSPDAV